MQDISIVLPRKSFRPLPGDNKVTALIEPVCDTVRISERVAALRGLRGFRSQSQELEKDALTNKVESNEELKNQDEKRIKRQRHFDRRTRVNESDRQVAEINISHDGDYAVAVCMAFDPPGTQIKEKILSDNGKGLPKHEPQWGDKGWFDPHEEKAVEDIQMDDLLEEPDDDNDPEAFRKAFKRALEGSEENDYRRLPPLP